MSGEKWATFTIRCRRCMEGRATGERNQKTSEFMIFATALEHALRA